jgi:hypothetical protein
LWYIISIIGKVFESSFLINLFGDTNITRIFYKVSQTYGTHTNDDTYLETERVEIKDVLRKQKVYWKNEKIYWEVRITSWRTSTVLGRRSSGAAAIMEPLDPSLLCMLATSTTDRSSIDRHACQLDPCTFRLLHVCKLNVLIALLQGMLPPVWFHSFGPHRQTVFDCYYVDVGGTLECAMCGSDVCYVTYVRNPRTCRRGWIRSLGLVQLFIDWLMLHTLSVSNYKAFQDSWRVKTS